MKILLQLVSILTVTAYALAQCDGCINDVCYEKRLITAMTLKYHNMAVIINKTNTMYTFVANSSKEYFASYNLDTNNLTLIFESTTSFGAYAFDQDNEEIYLVPSFQNGIYKFSANTNKLELYDGLRNEQITNVIFKDVLYFTKDKGLFKYQNGETQEISPFKNCTINDFFVDINDDIYVYTDCFRAGNYMCKLKNGATKPEVFSASIFTPTTDNTGHVVLIISNTIYRVNEYNGSISIKGAIGDNNLGLVLFDRDNNIVYQHKSSENETLWYRLTIRADKSRCAIKIHTD